MIEAMVATRTVLSFIDDDVAVTIANGAAGATCSAKATMECHVRIRQGIGTSK